MLPWTAGVRIAVEVTELFQLGLVINCASVLFSVLVRNWPLCCRQIISERTSSSRTSFERTWPRVSTSIHGNRNASGFWRSSMATCARLST